MSATTSSPRWRRALVTSALALVAMASSMPLMLPRAHADDGQAIRPFHVNIPEADLVELRRRVNATRWPDKETVNDRRRACLRPSCRNS